MPTDCIPYSETGYFSSLICDYLEEKETVKPLYHRFPTIENFKAQIEEKKNSFSESNRKILTQALRKQYEGIEVSEQTNQNLTALEEKNTFTVTTGHQLNLFTGPLYFLYKIISTINLTKKLSEAYPGHHFVPVYWMATEDHDFDEINYFNFKGKKFHWNRNASGAVGVLTTEGLDEVLSLFEKELGGGSNASYLKKLFTEAYLKHATLTAATRYLANALFAEEGLVIVDGDDAELKRMFVPYVKDELLNGTSFSRVSETIERIKNLEDVSYNIQVNPREINLFYLDKGIRERIVALDANSFLVNETDLKFTKDELLDMVEKHPEKFSPNVMMRPLYQEIILPNLCYIGGGGEIAYWLQLKNYFEAVGVPFPILLLRNSALLVSEKQAGKLKNLGIKNQQLFLKRDQFINKKVRDISNIDIDFTPQKKHLQEQFEALYTLAEQTDKSFLGAVKAQEIKQLKGLDALEKRLLKAQKRKLCDEVIRMTDLQNELFPNGSLQERTTNFSEFYDHYGKDLIVELLNELDPLKQEFAVITLP